ncbi:putative uncharacterized protein [Janthinobacterium agaricidamnosum NBRC 102515 = DSM 9628]|uniref:Transmembrane protein n=2 Tax=Janthinobacterium agaricidamnosum TaxID=55508 RepID=W0V8T6_9BURK|nr:putative uncharacterized protein [Janthinobacterium agaricidamnosum NBRC 102515 = DSM 9628]
MALLDHAQAELNASAVAAQQTLQMQVEMWNPALIQFLAVSMLVFTFGALLLGTLLLWRSKAPAMQVLRTIGVISIIGISALLLVVGYSNEQLTPIVGLFGAIAGYLLGKDSQPYAQASAAHEPQRPA